MGCKIDITKYRQHKYATLWIALSFAIALFAQCCLFHLFTAETSLFSCLLHPRRIITIYAQKAAISIFFASIVFLFRRKYWTVYVLCANTLWILAECIYTQSFEGMFMDAYSVSMAENLKGFESSIFMYFESRFLWLLAPILLYAIILFIFDNRQKLNWHLFIGFSLLAGLFNTINAIYVTRYYRNDLLADVTFTKVWNPITSSIIEASSSQYMYYYSELHSFIRVGYEMIHYNEAPVDEEKLSCEMQPFVHPMDSMPVPARKLVIFLIESLENWAITPDITPNICEYVEGHNVLWATRVKKQTKKGNSMDGQMLVNCGILPLNNGASCFRYPHNRYPSLSELYANAAILVPGGPKVWNQVYISEACGIDTNYTVSTDDAEIFKYYEQVAEKHDYVMVLTASTHSPFEEYAHNSSLTLPDGMPKLMRNYLRCINYMDKQVGHALQMIDSKEDLKNAVVVITGDHTIFTNKHREEFDSWCKQNGENFEVTDGYCPLILFAGEGQASSQIILHETYQMDIYPTILHIIGCEDYFWRGFGVNLADSSALSDRIIDEATAFDVSDRVIRSNWFNIEFGK